MSWPTDDLTTTHLDAATDDPSQARAELYALALKVKAILAARAVASGVCDLDASTLIPAARLSASIITTALGYTPWHPGNDGPGSGLDADTLDGYHAADLIEFGAGTTILFQQSTAPTGWTKITTYNDRALRVVSGTVSSGGVQAFSTVFGRTVTGSTALTTTHMPAHSHSFSGNTGTESNDHFHGYTDTYNSSNGVFSVGGGSGMDIRTGYSKATGGRNAVHTHAYSGTTSSAGSGSGHTHPQDNRVTFVDVIIAQKA